MIPRKNHIAAIIGKSMLIYGGQAENGMLCNDMIVLHMDNYEWGRISVKNGIPPFC